MTINKTSLNRVNFEDLKAACQAPTSDLAVMENRIECVTALIDQEIEDYAAAVDRLHLDRVDATRFNDTVTTRLIELRALKRVFNATLNAINEEECDDEDMQELKMIHKQSTIAAAFDEMQAGVMLRGLSTWHPYGWLRSNMNSKHTASPYSEQLSTVIQAYDSEYVRAVAFRLYA